VTASFTRWRFLLLTLLICAWLVAMPLIAGRWPIQLVLEALLLATVLVTLSANPGWRRLRYVLVVLWLVSVAGTVLSVFSVQGDAWQWYRTLELLTLVPVLAAVAAGMLAFVRRERTLTFDSIFATVAAYLLVAILFTQIYLCMMTWNPASFSLPVAVAGRAPDLLLGDMTYFSLVTLATVGYGDILPATSTARMLAMIQAVIGQFYLAVVVALFVGMYSSQRRD
jgi:voltage-gated potassium channel